MPKTSAKERQNFGAIRAYKSEIGFVQGSDGIKYSATLIDNTKKENEATYLVGVDDNNEDEEYWTWNYLVEVKKDSEGSCKVLSTKKIGVVVD